MNLSKAASQRDVRGIRSLLVRLVLIVYVPALLASAALVAIEARHVSHEAEEHLIEQAALMSRNLRLRIEGFESHLARSAQELPRNGDLREFDQAARRTALAAGLDGIILARPGGEQLVNTRLPFGAELPSGSPEALRAAARGGKTVVANLVRGPYTGRNLVSVNLPVMDGGRVEYVLTGVLEAKRLQELVANAPQGWLAGIADRNRIVVARNWEPETYVGRPMSSDLASHVSAEEQGVHRIVSFEGVPILTAFNRLPSIGWTVVFAVPSETLYAPVWRNSLLLAVGASAVLAYALWMAMRLRRGIVQSIQALVGEALGPPGNAPREPLAFAEANDLRAGLHASRLELAFAQRAVERMHAEFQRALVQQMDRRQAQVAAELHDNVGSGLAGISLLLAQVRPRVKDNGEQLLDALLRQVERVATTVRGLSRGMMPAGEEQGGLPSALEQLALEFGSVDRRCTFLARSDFTDLPVETAGHVYRIAQEAVTNAVRHGKCSRIRILLARAGGWTRLTVDDDGLGYDAEDPERRTGGMGLRSMRTRAMALGGDIEFTRAPLGGGRVRVAFPSPSKASAIPPAAPPCSPAAPAPARSS